VRVSHDINIFERGDVEIDDLWMNLERPPAEPEHKRTGVA
jgi:hypothetical protein